MKIENLASESQVQIQGPQLILYGGSFDPPHVGHRKLVEKVRGIFPAARLWILPSPQPAGASAVHKTMQASYQHRLNMCALNFMGAGDQLMISDLETGLPAPHYTINTIEHLLNKQAHLRIGLLLGQDQCRDFSRWYRPLDIIAKVDLIFVGRAGGEGLEETFLKMVATLGLQAEKIGADCYRWRHTQREIYLLPQQLSDAQSRLIRDNPTQAFANKWLEQAVYDYISKNKLYQKAAKAE